MNAKFQDESILKSRIESEKARKQSPVRQKEVCFIRDLKTRTYFQGDPLSEESSGVSSRIKPRAVLVHSIVRLRESEDLVD